MTIRTAQVPQGFFVTGTDTGVGKTLVACALLRCCVARGLRATGMKPVAAGAERCGEELRNEDVEALRAAGNVDAPREIVNPYGFALPVAPHIAAAAEGRAIEPHTIDSAYRRLRELSDIDVVDGVGGFLVPLVKGFDTAALAVRLALPVILVVGMRLGCLNHALLTAEAIAARGLTLRAWVANHIDGDMACAEQNVQALAERLPAPCLGRIPYGDRDTAAAAAHLDAGVIIASA